MKVEVYIKGQRLDLFDDESINLTQGVQDVKDISKIFADYSQSFNVPASKNNNRLFKNYYNADIDNGFDARTRKEGYITINTLPFKVGKIQLDGVKLKDNKPSSYQITFYGNAVKVKDLLGDDKLNDLEWLQNFNHEYNGFEVLQGMYQGLDFTIDGETYEKAIVYPLISYRRQYYYNSDPTDTTSTDKLVNIAYHPDRDNGVSFRDLKPAIKLPLVIKAIEKQYPELTFTGGFFESENFKNIYMNLSNNLDDVVQSNILVEDTTILIPYGGVGWLNVFIEIDPLPAYEFTPYKIKITIDGVDFYMSNEWLQGTNQVQQFITLPNPEYNVVFEVITTESFQFDATTNFTFMTADAFEYPIGDFPHNLSGFDLEVTTDIKNEIQNIKVYDFLTGLFKTFNLIVEARENSIMVEDLPTWYSEGRIIEIPPYVDTRNLEVEKGIIYNDMKFNFKETKQILAEEFELNNYRGFGDEELKLYEDETQERLLDGETLEIKSVFEHPMYERLPDLNTGELTTVQYGLYTNREIKPISGNPFLFYINKVSIDNNRVGYNVDDATYVDLLTHVFMPTRSRTIDGSDFTLSFASEFNEYTGRVPQQTIFSEYWMDYISDIFSVKRRNYKLEAILPTSIIQKLRLNDRLIIGNKRYIINKIQSNLTKRKDKLELLNDIYDAPLASDVLSNSIFSQSGGMYKKEATKDSIQYVGIAEQTPIVVDDKFGTNWVTIDNYGLGSVMTITFSIDENLTGSDRTVIIKIVDGKNNPTYTIFQYG